MSLTFEICNFEFGIFYLKIPEFYATCNNLISNTINTVSFTYAQI